MPSEVSRGGRTIYSILLPRSYKEPRCLGTHSNLLLQPAPKVGQTARQYAAGLLTVGSEGWRSDPDSGFTVSNRVFYKELEEGACKIVDVNIILLAWGTRTVPHSRCESTYLYSKLSNAVEAMVCLVPSHCAKPSGHVPSPGCPEPGHIGVRTHLIGAWGTLDLLAHSRRFLVPISLTFHCPAAALGTCGQCRDLGHDTYVLCYYRGPHWFLRYCIQIPILYVYHPAAAYLYKGRSYMLYPRRIYSNLPLPVIFYNYAIPLLLRCTGSTVLLIQLLL